MRRILFIVLFAIVSLNAFSQDVIKFLGIPIEGNKKEMISKLREKGYEYDSESVFYLESLMGRMFLFLDYCYIKLDMTHH